jgi:hypothetical protein
MENYSQEDLMKLTLENGTETESLNKSAISEAIGKLDGVENGYLMLAASDNVYMQAALQEAGLYALEYRTPKGEMMESDTWLTQAQLENVLNKFARGDQSFLRDVRWQEMVS